MGVFNSRNFKNYIPSVKVPPVVAGALPNRPVCPSDETIRLKAPGVVRKVRGPDMIIYPLVI